MLLKPKLRNNVSETNRPMNLVIMCGPNGTPFEFFTYSVIYFYD